MSDGGHDFHKVSGVCQKCGVHAIVAMGGVCPGHLPLASPHVVTDQDRQDIADAVVEHAIRREEKRLDQMVAAERMTKVKLLDAAKATVADRGVAYGGVEDNFARIATLWNAHLKNAGIVIMGIDLKPVDVAIMMVLMKTARLQNQPNHLDSWTDIAGYAACGAEISQDLPKPA